MEHMVVGLMVVTGQIEMTQLETIDFWTLWIGEGIDTGIILFLIHIGIMIVIVIILPGGVVGNTCWISLRKKIKLHLMEK